MHKMTSSLRERTLEQTLLLAEEFAGRVGITRVTNVTWLDKIGIPVFSSIRPGAARGSLCVNAGKGRFPDEAKVGAYMEAIEFHYAEFRNRASDTVELTVAEMMSQSACKFSFLDLNPILGLEIRGDDRVTCVHAQDLASGEKVPIPAELVYHPFLENAHKRIFGTSTNGLCSGNTMDEATLHGLAELMERDVQAFDEFKDRSSLVDLSSGSEVLCYLQSRIVEAGFSLALRHTPNVYGLPYFQAFILEEVVDSPVAICYGSAFHPCREIAAVRAITEAAQSRLTQIHGGRDDVTDRATYFSKHGGRPEERNATSAARKIVTDSSRRTTYLEVEDAGPKISNIRDGLDLLIGALHANGMKQILRCRLTPIDSSLTVVKIIVPGLEYFRPELKRVGPRLMQYIKATRATA